MSSIVLPPCYLQLVSQPGPLFCHDGQGHPRRIRRPVSRQQVRLVPSDGQVHVLRGEPVIGFRGINRGASGARAAWHQSIDLVLIYMLVCVCVCILVRLIEIFTLVLTQNQKRHKKAATEGKKNTAHTQTRARTATPVLERYRERFSCADHNAIAKCVCMGDSGNPQRPARSPRTPA